MKNQSNTPAPSMGNATERTIAFAKQVHKTRQGKARWDLIGELATPMPLAVANGITTTSSPCEFVRPPYAGEIFLVDFPIGIPNIPDRPDNLQDGYAWSKFDIGFAARFTTVAGCFANFRNSNCLDGRSAIKLTAMWRAMGSASHWVVAGGCSYSISVVISIQDMSTGEFVANFTETLAADRTFLPGGTTHIVDEDFRFTEMIIPWYKVYPNRDYRINFVIVTTADVGFIAHCEGDVLAQLFAITYCCIPEIIP